MSGNETSSVLALRESEQRYRMLMEQASDGIHTYDFQGNFIEVNTRLCEMLGYTSEQLLRLNVKDLIPAEELASSPIRFNELRSGKTIIRERQLLRQDGGLLAVEISGRMLQEGVLLGIVRDITSRKQAEEKLRQSEEWLRAILEVSRDGILVEENETIVYANRSYRLLFGYEKPEELIGQNISVVLSGDDQERLLEYGRRRRRGQDTPSLYEFKGQRKDGTLLDLEAAVSTSIINGQTHIITAARDIAERKQAQEALRQAHDGLEKRVAERTAELAKTNEALQAEIAERKRTEETLRESEQRLRIALRTSKMGTWQLHLATGAVLASATCKAHFGLAPETELSYETLLAAIHPEDRDRVSDAVAQAVESQRDYDAEYRNIWPDGSTHWIIARGSGVDGADGKPFRMIGVTLDITERKQAEEARRELLRQLVTAQEDERRRIARELHDQMGQHLTALTLGLRELGDGVQFSDRACAKLRQLQELTNQVSREMHALAMDLRPTTLDDLGLQTALGNYLEQWMERTRISTDLHSIGFDEHRLHPNVETALYRIVQEAVTNVIKHAQADRVGVILERRPGHVLTIVEDNGQGFDVEAVMRKPVTQGWLGLLGIRERVTLLGGTLNIESSPGIGTAVFVRIPISENENGQSHHA